MLRRLAFAAIVVAAAGAASPALALHCYGVDQSGAPQITLRFGIGFGERREEDELRYYARQLQRRGVDTDQVEFWSGCLRAYVRQPGGGVRMEFYDPETLQQVFP